MLKWLLSKRQKITVGKYVENKETVYTVGRNLKSYTYYENNTEVPQKKLQIEQPCNPAFLLLDMHPKEIKSVREIFVYTFMFTVALFAILKIWKQPK